MKATDLPVIALHGTPHEQGKTYGARVPTQMARMRELWWRELHEEGLEPAAWEASLAQRFRAIHEQRVPGFMAFVKGIAEGSGLPFDAVFALNLVDEDVVARRLRLAARPRPSTNGERCTVLAGRGPDGPVGGQTQDLGGAMEGLQVLLHFMPSTGVERYALSLAGMAALSGMNAHGLATFQNQVLQLDSHPVGISVMALVHEVLQCPQREQALQLLNEMPHAAGQAYTIVDSAGVSGVEGSIQGALPYPPRPQGHLAHTNHPLRADGWRAAEPAGQVGGIRTVSARTRARLERICALGDASPALTAEGLMGFFADRQHPVCPISLEPSAEADAIGYTVGAIVCQAAGPDGPRFWLASGPPSMEPFVQYPFAA